MDLASIIKLIMRNGKLVVGIPILLTLLAVLVTQHEKHQYTSGMTIFTGIASGFSLGSVDEAVRVDMFNTNNQFDNFINILKSKETYQEVALRLLAQDLALNAPDKLFIDAENYKKLQENVPDEIKRLAVKGNPDETYNNFLKFLSSNDDNYLAELLDSNDPHYSFYALGKINVKRIANSDLVNVDYQCDDPGISYQTLLILSKVFVKNYKAIKVTQTDAVVKYFEHELALISVKLRDAEDRLLAYYKNNSVINYNEQTRYIAEQKEYFETDYVREKMSYASNKAAAQALESKMNFQQKIFLKNDSIVRLRNEIYRMNLKQAENRLNIRDTGAVRKSSSTLGYKKQIDSLVSKLNYEVLNSIRLKSSVEGIAADKILNEWLDYVVSSEGSRAKIEVMDKRLENFKNIYVKMAPVGATIKRIEREIEINEQQYLSVLHGLNMAKLKQQDVEMTSTIKLMDEPYFPLKPLSSSRKMIVAATFIGSLLMIVAIILAMEYMDRSIRTAERAAKQVGLKVLGVYPHLSNKKKWVDDVAQQLSKIASQDIVNDMESPPLRVGVISTLNGEGKTTVITSLMKSMLELGIKPAHFDNKTLLHDPEPEENTKVVFYELPSILLSPVSADIISLVDIFILVVRANREWRPSDIRAVDILKDSCTKPVSVILNGVEEDGLEHYLGDLPKPRSRFRAWAKKILTFNFFGKEKLKPA